MHASKAIAFLAACSSACVFAAPAESPLRQGTEPSFERAASPRSQSNKRSPGPRQADRPIRWDALDPKAVERSNARAAAASSPFLPEFR